MRGCRAQRTASAIALLGWLLIVPPGIRAAEQDRVDFSRDIRPILAGHCLNCHGPDASTRKADLRLDTADVAMADRGGSRVVVPGSPDKSLLLERVASSDPDTRMPPADSAVPRLSDEQLRLLRLWIEQGAPWAEHWSWVRPSRSQLPAVDQPGWPRLAIDNFILRRLEQEQLAPSPVAEKPVLLRRVTQTLTGLPPTLDEADAFLADDSPDGYERTVDRLLASPRYGEQMTLGWLDAARYADTSGYQADWERFMWPWRDWVVDAFNAGMPFDQFTIEQLAGDMLPNASPSQVLASGFNRNHRINDEGGSLDAEFEIEYVADRVDTTSTVWLGLTAGCARCHDHKYDPLTQREYYRLFAFFNNVPEKGIDGRKGAAKPYLELPDHRVQRRIAALRERLAALQVGPGTSSAPELLALQEEIKKLEAKAMTQVQVMQELPQRRPTYLLQRGVYDRPDLSEPLSPALPLSLGEISAGPSANETPDRLALALWIVSPENPLTARVTVNRFWQHHFGSGLVRTAEDFGSRGERPSHPELLDWLATELVRREWDVKTLHREIVVSATFRQSSRVAPELLRRDPGNRLLARGPRRRLSGAAIRDQALFAGGLLSHMLGGPPVKPYQPVGLWEELSFGNGKTSVDFYVQDHGESLYRRSLYTFWKRTVAPPGLAVFDGGGREMCRVRVEMTNTPMQALALQNDMTFVEATRHLARRMLVESGPTDDERLGHGWRLLLARQPEPAELDLLRESLAWYRSVFRQDSDAAHRLTSYGESPRETQIDTLELAAWTMIAQTILNLDESITGE